MAEQREVMNFVFTFLYFLYLLLYTSIHKYIYIMSFCDPTENRGMPGMPECANSAIECYQNTLEYLTWLEYTGIPEERIINVKPIMLIVYIDIYIY